MKKDIEIAREVTLQPITEVAQRMGVPQDALEQYGKFMAKVPASLVNEERVAKSKLILVTAISPTKAGIGKTTVSVGLSMGLCRIGKKAVVALREPSLGPCFGMKGGAAGGGYSQVVPMEKINLHFTGDMHAVTTAHNMVATLLDNYIFRHQGEPTQLKKVYWKRVLDINDRALRQVVTGLGDGNGVVRESGFDITTASEIMAILCLSRDADDLRNRLDNILLGVTCEGRPFYLRELGVTGSIVVLLLDALSPNLVQTLEHTPALVHGGPFANIAHGCNSVMATKLAMTYGDYVVTEAGFGADLGAEKFFDIKCRTAQLQPCLTVLVATIRGLKNQGGLEQGTLSEMDALRAGMANLDRHVANLQSFGQPVVVTVNKHAEDTDEELELVRKHCAEKGVAMVANDAWAEGGRGCEALAACCVEEIEKQSVQTLHYAYDLEDDVQTKVSKVATQLYGAAKVEWGAKAKKQLKLVKEWQWEHLPVCIAKTQYSFTDDAAVTGAPQGFTITVDDVVINSGAGMIVVVMGGILRMPGLPKHPQAERIDWVDGLIEGLD